MGRVKRLQPIDVRIGILVSAAGDVIVMGGPAAKESVEDLRSELWGIVDWPEGVMERFFFYRVTVEPPSQEIIGGLKLEASNTDTCPPPWDREKELAELTAIEVNAWRAWNESGLDGIVEKEKALDAARIARDAFLKESSHVFAKTDLGG